MNPGTHPKDGESEAEGEDKPGTHPKDGESEAEGEDKPATRCEAVGLGDRRKPRIGNSSVP
ncbi:MAG: hypothetical protein DRH20_02180 [Deltaproteobacteria bacterium]|nr:MAG: hypothetical protein DRH20_02180 [Deltaproteobacteria bacterium]